MAVRSCRDNGVGWGAGVPWMLEAGWLELGPSKANTPGPWVGWLS